MKKSNNFEEPSLFDDPQKSANSTGLETKPNLSSAPLAERMRPQRIEEFIGQESLLGAKSPLRRAIEEDRVHSFILWGPPGTGKTTLARLIAGHTERHFIALSAVLSGVRDIKDSIEVAQNQRRLFQKRTILFVDEIHRFNKSQQDALLPYVEDGTVTLIGATTENPSFELNSALLSRAPVFVLKQLSEEELLQILNKALSDPTRGVSDRVVNKAGQAFPEPWLKKIAEIANGDGRRALTLLERIADFWAATREELKTDADLEAFFEKAVGSKVLRYDATGEEHYNTISAFIKSMRDSDPDAALYYAARMLEGGEDPLFLVRRLVIFASEDIGNADPRALQVALNVKDAVDFVGMPEARISLAQAITYLACAPKSNASYMGIEAALADARELGNLEIPMHIRNAPTKMMKGMGYGKGYKYAHDQEAGFSERSNLPDLIQKKTYYQPKDSGLEKQIKERVQYLRSRRKDAN